MLNAGFFRLPNEGLPARAVVIISKLSIPAETRLIPQKPLAPNLGIYRNRDTETEEIFANSWINLILNTPILEINPTSNLWIQFFVKETISAAPHNNLTTNTTKRLAPDLCIFRNQSTKTEEIFADSLCELPSSPPHHHLAQFCIETAKAEEICSNSLWELNAQVYRPLQKPWAFLKTTVTLLRSISSSHFDSISLAHSSFHCKWCQKITLPET